VYRIVEDHEGVISVDSEVGKGTRFIIKLPLSNEQDSSSILNGKLSRADAAGEGISR